MNAEALNNYCNNNPYIAIIMHSDCKLDKFMLEHDLYDYKYEHSGTKIS